VLLTLAVAGWFAALAVGRMPKGMRDLGAYCLRYSAQTGGYLLLLTDRYPTLASAEVRREQPAEPEHAEPDPWGPDPEPREPA
jgi:hypothetical protein